MSPAQILIVDDEASVRGILSALLTHSGHVTTLADGTDQALQHLREHPGFDLVLSDISMPGAGGFDLLDHIHLARPDLPVILISALSDFHIVVRAFRSGASDYLLKPFERSGLDAVVSGALARSRARKKADEDRNLLGMVARTRTRNLYRTVQDLERSCDFALEAMGDAIALRDAETQGHCRRVTAYAIALGRAMGLPSAQLRVLARGAFLHDIGKIGIPDNILLKPGKLDEDEILIMRQHCRSGYDVVRKIPFLSEASEIVHAHQESFDGAGYPRGLRGHEIPLGARIFAVADTFDAITTDRPYREGRGFAEAIREIVRCSGAQFDPDVVAALLQLPQHTWTRLREGIACHPVETLHQTLCQLGVA